MKPFQGAQIPFEPADPKNFVGSARVKRLPMVEERGQSVIVYLVEFEPADGPTGTATALRSCCSCKTGPRAGAEMGRAGARNRRPVTRFASNPAKNIGTAPPLGQEWRTSPSI